MKHFGLFLLLDTSLRTNIGNCSFNCVRVLRIFTNEKRIKNRRFMSIIT